MRNNDTSARIYEELQAALAIPEEAETKEEATEEQNPETQPEDNGGRTFTQEEVNRIVSDRLARERAKNGDSEKENELKRRENMITFREYLCDEGLPAELLGLFASVDLESLDGFKSTLEKFFFVVDMLRARVENEEYEQREPQEEKKSDPLKLIFGKEGEEAYYGY